MPPERRVALARLGQPISDYSTYARLDLPLIVGRLGSEQQEAFSAKLALPHTREDANTNHTKVNDDFAALARHLTQKEVLQSLRPIVSDILQFDRSTFKDKLLGVELFFVRDTPGPNPKDTLAPVWHRDKNYGVEHNNPKDYLTGSLPPRRYYTVRSAAPMEIIRDIAGTTPQGRALTQHAAERNNPASPAYQAWLQAVKDAGLYLQPKPFEIVLTSGEATLHKSHQPDVATPSVYLQMRMLTAAAPMSPVKRIGLWLDDRLHKLQRA